MVSVDVESEAYILLPVDCQVGRCTADGFNQGHAGAAIEHAEWLDGGFVHGHRGLHPMVAHFGKHDAKCCIERAFAMLIEGLHTYIRRVKKDVFHFAAK